MLALLRDRSLRPMLLVALALFAAKAAFVLATPLRALTLSYWLIDDSFIVMQVARNVALGHGFSFDGLHPTTGVSMLWTYLTSLNHLVFSKDLAVKATLIESSLAGAVSTIVVFMMALRITQNRIVAWIAFLLVSLLPALFFNALNGMETALFSLCVLLAIAYATDTFGRERTPLMRGLSAGIFAGLALMMRADAIFLIAAIGVIFAWRFVRLPAERRYTGKLIVGLLIGTAICFAIFSLWQLWQTGSLFPDNQIGRRAIALSKHDFSYDQFSLPNYLKIVVWNVFEFDELWSLALGSSLLGFLALLWHLRGHALSPIATLTALYLFSFGSALVLYQWYFPELHGLRYINPGAHLVAILLAALVNAWPAMRMRPLLMSAFLCSLLILSWYRYYDSVRRPVWAAEMHLFGQRSMEKQAHFWSTIDYIQEKIPADAVIAVRDHGRIAFFTDRPIQDLAGILDPGILDAYKEGSLQSYLAERNVSYIMLPDSNPARTSIYEALHASLALEKVPDAPMGGMPGFTLYKIIGM